MSCNIILLIPPAKIFSVIYPLGLGYIAAILKQYNYPVTLLNYSRNDYSAGKLLKEIQILQPDFIGITVFTFAYPMVKTLIARIKDILPQTKIIVGGPHVSALPEFSLKDLKADYAVEGEGEYAFLKIIQNENPALLNNAPGIAFWYNGRQKYNPGCNIIADLNLLPIPRWELMAPADYADVGGTIWSKKSPLAPLVTSRGCPHHCIFCSSHLIHGKSLRKRSKEKVTGEIEFLIKNYGVKEIDIYDDNFCEDKNHAAGICGEIIRKKFRIAWRTTVGVRLDSLDAELLRLFKASGCYQISFGIESFSSDILHQIKKPIRQSEITARIRMIKQYNLETMGYFILGLPGETPESIKATIRFARNADIDFASFTQAIPLPGTELFTRLALEKKLAGLDWNHFFFYTARPFSLSSVSQRQLRYFYLMAYLRVYSKPKRILRILRLSGARKLRIKKIVFFLKEMLANLFL